MMQAKSSRALIGAVLSLCLFAPALPQGAGPVPLNYLVRAPFEGMRRANIAAMPAEIDLAGDDMSLMADMIRAGAPRTGSQTEFGACLYLDKAELRPPIGSANWNSIRS